MLSFAEAEHDRYHLNHSYVFNVSSIPVPSPFPEIIFKWAWISSALRFIFIKPLPWVSEFTGIPVPLSRITRTIVLLSVFNEIQDDPKIKLTQFAKDYPRDFYQIASRLIPTEITGSLKTVIKVTDLDE